jgi:raffinose/stachyose/melibiose transport system substrate-binding protein
MDRMTDPRAPRGAHTRASWARRRAVSLAAGAALALSLAPVSPATAEDGSFSVWLGGILAQATPGSPLRQWYDEQVATFQDAHPGVTVETVLQDPDGVKQVAGFRAAFGAGDGPDVAMMYPGGFVTTFASSLLDLSQVAPDVVAQFPPDLLRYGCEGFDCAGKPILLVPSDFSGWVFAYNKDIFDQVGIQAPIATWDDLLAAGQKLKDAGFTPFQMGDRDGYIADAYLSNMETSFLTSEDLSALLAGQLPLTDEKFVAPLRMWADLYARGFVNEDACTLEAIASQQDFTAGKAATVPTYDTANVAKAMGDKVGAMPWPAIDGSTTAGAAAQVGQGWVITRFAQDQALAAAFLAQITSADAQSRALELAGLPPSNPAADSSKASDPLSAAGVEQWTKNFKLLSLNTILPIETQTDYFKETAQALCGQKTPEEAMAAVQATFEGERGG